MPFRLLLLLAPFAIGCGDREAPTPLRWASGPTDLRSIEACFGGQRARDGELISVAEAPTGWVTFRGRFGRCEGSDQPVHARIVEGDGAAERVLYETRVAPSDAPVVETFAFMTQLARGQRIRFQLRGGDAPLFLGQVQATVSTRPDGLPPEVEVVAATRLAAHGDGLRLTAPARVAFRFPAGAHTLAGRHGALDGDGLRFVFLRAGEGLPPILRWHSGGARTAPFMTSWASRTDSPIELWIMGEGDAVLDEVRAWTQPFPALPPTQPASAEPPSAGPIALFRADGAVGTRRCGERALEVAPEGWVTVRLPPGPRVVTGWAGVCEPEQPGSATFRLDGHGGDGPLWVGELVWEGGDSRASRVEAELPDTGAAWREITLSSPRPDTEGLGAAGWSGFAFAFPVVEVRASGFNESAHNRDYAPELAHDGDDRTEWHLPDGESGWIELDLGAPRHVSAVALTNGHNPGYDDRAARRVVVHALRSDAVGGHEVLGEATGEFEAFSTEGERMIVPLSAEGVDRVRVYVRSHFRNSGALAEVQVL